MLFCCWFLLLHWAWVKGSSWSHRPPSARRTSWGRRRTFPEVVPSLGSFPGSRRNLSSVRATTTRSSARANFCPIQFLWTQEESSHTSDTLKVPPWWWVGTWALRRRGWRHEKTRSPGLWGQISEDQSPEEKNPSGWGANNNCSKWGNLGRETLPEGLSRQQGCGVFHKYWPDRWHLQNN